MPGAYGSSDIFDVSGAIVIVTGGASGLGLSIAEVMAANGARVLILDIDEARLDECQAKFRAAGLALDVGKLDVADIPALRDAIHAAAERYGRIDAVFANAGISAGSGPFTESGQIANVSEERWNHVLQINLTAVFATIQAASVHMKRQRGRRIVVTASVAGSAGRAPCRLCLCRDQGARSLISSGMPPSSWQSLACA